MDALKSWWQSLPPKDQKMLRLGGIVLAPLLFYMLIIDPMHIAKDQALDQRNAAREAFATMSQKAAEIKASGKASSVATGSLLSFIENSAQKQGLRQYLKRLQPSGNDNIQITLEGAGYQPLISWLDTLRKQGIHSKRAEIKRDNKTQTINAQLMLSR